MAHSDNTDFDVAKYEETVINASNMREASDRASLAFQDKPLNHQLNTSSSSLSNPASSSKNSIKLSTKFRKYTSETYKNTPILHPTTITSTADIILKIIENEQIIAIIPLHKQLLIDNIPYFSTRLNSTWENTGDISLDTEVASADLIFKYFQMKYNSEAILDKTNAGGLFQLSEYLQDEEITNVFKDFIRENIDSSLFFVAWRMDDDFVEIECLNFLKKYGLFGLLDGFQQFGAQLIESSLCKFIEKAVEVIKPREQGHLLDLLKFWLVEHDIKTIESYTRIFHKIPFDKFITHFKQIFKLHLLEMLDPESKLSEIKPLMIRILDETKIGSSNIGSSNTINNKEIRKRIFPHETLSQIQDDDKNEHLIPFKKIKEDKAEYRGGAIANNQTVKAAKSGTTVPSTTANGKTVFRTAPALERGPTMGCFLESGWTANGERVLIFGRLVQLTWASLKTSKGMVTVYSFTITATGTLENGKMI